MPSNKTGLMALFIVPSKFTKSLNIMRKILSLALVALLTMPCVLRAEAIEIQLMEVIQMSTLPGDNPLDGPDILLNMLRTRNIEIEFKYL